MEGVILTYIRTSSKCEPFPAAATAVVIVAVVAVVVVAVVVVVVVVAVAVIKPFDCCRLETRWGKSLKRTTSTMVK